MTDGDTGPGWIDILERALDIRFATVDLIDAGDWQWQCDRGIRQEAHSPRGHRSDNVLRAGPIVMVTEDREDAVAGAEVPNKVAEERNVSMPGDEVAAEQDHVWI